MILRHAFGVRCLYWVRFALYAATDRWESEIRTPMNRDEIPGSKLDAGVGWAWFVTPPVFGVALSAITQRIIPQLGRKSKFLAVF